MRPPAPVRLSSLRAELLDLCYLPDPIGDEAWHRFCVLLAEWVCWRVSLHERRN